MHTTKVNGSLGMRITSIYSIEKNDVEIMLRSLRRKKIARIKFDMPAELLKG